MKNKFCLLVASALAVLAAMSCSKEEGTTEDKTPDGPSVLTISSTEVSALGAGGTYSVDYIVTGSSTGYIETIADDSWVHSFSVDESAGTISFVVDANTGEASRQTRVTVLYSEAEDAAVFTVVQDTYDPTKVLLSDFQDSSWSAYVAEFDKEETLAMYINPESGYPTGISITAWEFAQDYANRWNVLYPYNPISPEDAMEVEFSEEANAYCSIVFGGDRITLNEGYISGSSILRINGEFEFDESTGIMTVYDTANSLYNREEQILLTKDGDDLLFRVLYVSSWGDIMTEYYGTNWYLSLNFYDPNREYLYSFHGYIQYRLTRTE